MNAPRQKQLQTRPASSPPLSAAPTSLLQRKCACGGTAGIDGQCEQCRLTQLQRRRADQDELGGVPTIVLDVLRSPGHPLDSGTNAFFKPRFGQDSGRVKSANATRWPSPHLQISNPHNQQEQEASSVAEQVIRRSPPDRNVGEYDLSQIRVHSDLRAAESAEALNARAYTVGKDVVFGEGEYAPDTSNGMRLMAHELAHAVQQQGDSTSIQRLIRTPYPWQGVITPAIGANIRSSPDASSPGNIIDSIPRGQPVTVISNSGNWLQVESRYRGPLVTGYIFHTLVDDATSSSMAASVGTTMVWRPSGPASGTDFQSWASAATETPFPAVTSTTVMNCWEAVLLSAYRSGSITWSWIHHMYTAEPMANWVATMSRGARHTYSVPGPNLNMPQRGDIVFFNGLAHVALATGTGSEVYTFWPPPNTPFTAGGTTDRVKVFTIEALVAWWSANMPPPAPVVEFGAPSW